jgi:hypothetical protein
LSPWENAERERRLPKAGATTQRAYVGDPEGQDSNAGRTPGKQHQIASVENDGPREGSSTELINNRTGAAYLNKDWKDRPGTDCNLTISPGTDVPV